MHHRGERQMSSKGGDANRHNRSKKDMAAKRKEKAAPPGSTENYTLVEISMFPGRSLAAKRKLYKKIVENLSTLGIPAKDIRIVLHEVPMDNWGIRGGVPASEVDIGFKVDV